MLNILNMLYTLRFFFSSKCSLFHNANLFGSCIIHILYTECAKITRNNNSGAKELKCTLVQALRLCTGRTAHRGSRGVALLFLDHSTRRGWVVSSTPRPLFTPGKDPVLVVQEAGWAPGAENLAPTGIRFPDCPARSQLLYWLCYPAHSMWNV